MSSNICKEIRTWKDLKEFGFNGLTGESCRFGMRYLVDLNEKAENLLSEFFGGIKFTAANWNSVGTSSVMLPHSILKELGTFVLLCSGYPYVLEYTGHIHGVDQETFDQYMELYNEEGNRSLFGFVRTWHNGGGGTRNRHQMSGRVE